MNRTRFVARTLVAGIAVTAMSLIAASPASAHTSNIYTYLDYNGDGQVGFSTISRTNADVVPLPDAVAVPDTSRVLGSEVVNEVGTSIAVDYSVFPNAYSIITWDHSTGAIKSTLPITLAAPPVLNDIYALDTLANGTLLTYLGYSVPVEGGSEFKVDIATLDPATGILLPAVDLDPLYLQFPEAEVDLISLATDPITGQSYAFITVYDDEPTTWYVPFDSAAHTLGTAVQFGGFDSGQIAGADFDSDGSLFFFFYADRVELSSVGATSTWPTAARTVVGEAGTNLGETSIENLNLTVENAPLLAETGAEFPALWLAAGGFAVLAGAVTIVVTKRRKTGAVV